MRKWPLFLLVLFGFWSPSIAGDSITLEEAIKDDQTLISAGGNFELGFFTPGNSRNRYLGIWYKKIPVRTIVWVANRENPVTVSSSNLTIGNSGNLIIQSRAGKILWSTGSSNLSSPVAQLLDSGNFVLMDASNNSESIVWQSFDYPCDTLLPGMKHGWTRKPNLNRILTTWKSPNDPSPGDYSYKQDLLGAPEMFIWNRQAKIYRSGPWTGFQFSGEQEMKSNNYFSFNFTSNQDELYYTYKNLNSSVISRFVLNQSIAQRYVWIDSKVTWYLYWSLPKDQCDHYALCGRYGVCNSNDLAICECLKGFEPKSPLEWSLRDGSSGCVRRTQLNCQNGDGFLKMTRMKLPDTSLAILDESMNLEECGLWCSRNCSCTAYSSANIIAGGSGCIAWVGDLIDLRGFLDNGQDLYIRLAASEFDLAHENSSKTQVIVILIVIIASVILLLGSSVCCILKKKMKSYSYIGSAQMLLSFDSFCTDHCANELPLFDLDTVVCATDNFLAANKLGEGGFGPVYKGKLGEDQYIAIKRLSRNSLQGLEEFKNEVMLIVKLQHVNLVRLLGCCIHGEERMLIYEYMHNRSLDTFIFDKTKAMLLTWQKRFNIIVGIARGLLYLHQDSRLRIIHRDLKPSNILLDRDMNPKVSDFGVARIFGDRTDEHTKKPIGTRGYMSPEYAMAGIFSVKSDVFSFGVLLLEIISGKKNKAIYYAEPEPNLLSYAWNFWVEGNSLELLDQSISSLYSLPEVLRCIQVGLLCVQERAKDRPEMSSVVMMLGSAQVVLPQPNPPGFCIGRSLINTESAPSCSVNDITITMVEGR